MKRQIGGSTPPPSPTSTGANDRLGYQGVGKRTRVPALQATTANVQSPEAAADPRLELPGSGRGLASLRVASDVFQEGARNIFQDEAIHRPRVQSRNADQRFMPTEAEVHVPEVIRSAVGSPKAFVKERMPELLKALNDGMKMGELSFEDLSTIRALFVKHNIEMINDDLQIDSLEIPEIENAFRQLSVAYDPEDSFPNSFSGVETKRVLDDYSKTVETVLKSDEFTSLVKVHKNSLQISNIDQKAISDKFTSMVRDQWRQNIAEDDANLMHSVELREIETRHHKLSKYDVGGFNQALSQMSLNIDRGYDLPNLLLTLSHEVFHALQNDAIDSAADNDQSNLWNSDFLASLIFSESWLNYLDLAGIEDRPVPSLALTDEAKRVSHTEVQAYHLEHMLLESIQELVGEENWEPQRSAVQLPEKVFDGITDLRFSRRKG